MAVVTIFTGQYLRQSESTGGRRRIGFTLTLAGAGVGSITPTGAEFQVSNNGGAFANAAGTWSAVGGCAYQYEYTSGELGSPGWICLKVIKTGIDDHYIYADVHVWNLNEVTSGNPLVTVGAINTGAIVSTSFAAGAFNPLLDTARSGHTAAGTVGQSLELIVCPTNSVANDGLNSATSFKTNLSQTGTNHWKDAFLRFTSGALLNQSHRITAYDGSTKFVTVASAYSGIPANGDTFELVVR